MITAQTGHDSSLLTLTIYESRVDEDIVLSDYNTNPCLSFPLRSGFAYRTTAFDRFVESNCFLVESQSNEYDIKKYRDLGTDLTICFQFKDEHDFITRLTRNRCAALFRRTPALGFMIHNLMNNLDKGRLFLDEIIDQILFEEVFHDSLEANQPRENRRWRLDQVDEAKAYMHANYNANIDIEQIAAASCLSRYHFSRTFKGITGYSPYDYLLRVRLHNAREQLKRDRNVTEVAFQTGFNSLENFSSAFKKAYNTSPANYRNSFRRVYGVERY